MQYGTTAEAELIGTANGVTDDTLFFGQRLKMPQAMPLSYQAGNAEPYNEFMNTVLYALMPKLKAKQKKQSGGFWDGVIDAVIIIASAAVGAMTGGVGGILLAAAMGSVLEAGAEEVEIQLGWREHFSLSHALDIGLESGFAAFGAEILPGIGAAHGLMAEIAAAGAVAATEQLAEMALGLRHHFDIDSVITQMVTIVIASKLPVLKSAGTSVEGEAELESEKAAENVVETVASGITEHLLDGKPIDWDSLAISFIGAEVQSEMPQPKVGSQASIKNQALAKSIGDDPGKIESFFEEIGSDIEIGFKSAENYLESAFSAPKIAPNANKGLARNPSSFFSGSTRKSIPQPKADVSGANSAGYYDPNSMDSIQDQIKAGLGKGLGLGDINNAAQGSSSNGAISSSNPPSLMGGIWHELKEEVSNIGTYLHPSADAAGKLLGNVAGGYHSQAQSYSEYASQVFQEANDIEYGDELLISLEKEAQMNLLNETSTEYFAKAAMYKNIGVGLDLGVELLSNKAMLALAYGLEVENAYEQVQAAPPAFKKYMEIKEYGGVGANALGFFGGTYLTKGNILVGAVGGILAEGIYKGIIDDIYGTFGPEESKSKNSFD